MTKVPLIPLDIEGASDQGLFTPKGLKTECPGELTPKPTNIDPASVPSPLALSEATTVLLEPQQDSQSDGMALDPEADNHPLVEGAELLLHGLVSGDLRLRWVSIRDLDSGALTKSLRNTFPHEDDLPFRLGLVLEPGESNSREDDTVWGYVGPNSIPTLAGAQYDQVGVLRNNINNTDTEDAIVATLLARIRRPLERRGDWLGSVQFPWMVLFERLIDRLGPPDRDKVDLVEDVRSFGPFAFEVPHPDKDNVTLRRSTYLLGYAPGFPKRLARSMTGRFVTPDDEDGTNGRRQLQDDSGRNVAWFHDTAGASIDDPYLGEGCPAYVTHSIPEKLPPVTQLGESECFHFFERDHLSHFKNALGPLTDAIQEQPHRVSDVVRAVARYAPEAIDESQPLCFSPICESYFENAGQQLRPNAAELESLVEGGGAFLLEPSDEDRDLAAFVEHGTVDPAQEQHDIGDLSRLGTALWKAFNGANYDPDIGFYDQSGKPLLDTGVEAFPIAAGKPVRDWWDDRSHVQDTSERLATLQRFRAAYQAGEEANQEARFLEAAVEAFLARLPSDYDALMEPLEGTRLTADQPRVVELDHYSELEIVTDPFRAS